MGDWPEVPVGDRDLFLLRWIAWRGESASPGFTEIWNTSSGGRQKVCGGIYEIVDQGLCALRVSAVK
jgi:hypothetical protein